MGDDDRAAMTTTCPSDDELADASAEHIDEGVITRLEHHLARCAGCRAAIGILATRDASTTAGPVDAAALQPVDPAAYEVRSELARGGMGRILDAWDRRHGRRVAIKVLLRNEPGALARFIREARITARLQHPSIVPFYEAGRWSDGEPFFAMKLVEGRSLADVIAERPRFADRVALVSHLIAATDALAYAHAAGIIHRDLKPANVLIGAYGETVVIDWGIAKQLGDADEPGGTALDGPALVTAMGSAIGTPCYMPPEQAAGMRVDERADVYALGALIYHVLAGAPPYASDASTGVVTKVLHGPPAPLAELAPEAPADLVAIVDKAMARAPEDRYTGADRMAADLREFAAGRLVSARVYSLRALLRRWIARHRALFAMAAVLVVAVATTATIGIRQVVRERDRADAAKRVAVSERDAAETLVEYMVGELRKKLDTAGRLDLMAGLGSEVSHYYDRVSPSDDALDAAALDRRATALQTLGEVEEQKQNMDASIALYTAASALFGKSLARQPDDLDAAAASIDGQIRMARIDYSRGKLDDGLHRLDDATARAERLLAGHPGPRLQMLLSKARGSRGMLLAGLGKDQPSIDAYHAALDLAVRATAAAPDRVDWQAQLGRAYFDVGYAEGSHAHLDAAADAYAHSADVRERAQRLPLAQVATLQRDLAWTYMMLGEVERARGRVAAAIDDGARACATTAALRKRDPDNLDYARDALAALYQNCEILIGAEHYDDAATSCRDAIPIGETLLAHDPRGDTPQDDLRRVLQEAGRAEIGRQRPDLARPLVDRAITVAEAADRAVHNALSVHGLTSALFVAARAYLAAGDLATARRHYLAALDAGARAVHDFPDSDDNASELAEARLAGALVEAARGDLAAAAPLYSAALAAKTTDLASEPRDTLTLRSLGELLAIRPRLAPSSRCTGIPALTAAVAKVPTELASTPQVRSLVAALPSDCGH